MQKKLSYQSVSELISLAESLGKKISDIVLKDQAAQMELPEERLLETMYGRLTVMKESVEKGLATDRLSASGLSGGDAVRMIHFMESGASWFHELDGVIAKALAAAEQNAAMGRICAAPTAGSCGILPAVLLTAMEQRHLSENDVTMALFTASGIGMVIANRASVSGASGGCQAECGSAAAMAAGALVELEGGTPAMVGHACALTLKGILGLVCDPVAGLVEVPCVKRNAIGTVHALAATEMAMAGIESKIPVDEVIGAMREVGGLLPQSLKETSKAGLAATKTAKSYRERMKTNDESNQVRPTG